MRPSMNKALQTCWHIFALPAILAAGLTLAPSGVRCSEPTTPPSLAATPALANPMARAKQQIARALLPRRVVAYLPITNGFSEASAFRVETHGGEHFFAKVVTDWADIKKPQEMRTEPQAAAWAAARGLAPAVIAMDTELGLLITAFLPNELLASHEGEQAPWQTATLATMRRLHKGEPSMAQGIFEKVPALVKWAEELSKTPLEPSQAARVARATQVVEACVDRLAEQAYSRSPCHGDLHKDNVIFSGGRAYFIDWGTRHSGDAMQEVAYFAYHIDVPLSRFEALLQQYAPLSVEDIERAKCHLVLLHAHRYLMTLRGMPWDLPEARATKVRMHEAYLVEDARWLGL